MNESNGGVGAYLLVMLIAGGAGFYLGTQNQTGEGVAVEAEIDCNSQAVRDCANAEPIYKVPVGDAVTKGKADALVTIVEVSEFQCPFCSRVNKTLDALQKGRLKNKNLQVPRVHQGEPGAGMGVGRLKGGGDSLSRKA